MGLLVIVLLGPAQAKAGDDSSLLTMQVIHSRNGYAAGGQYPLALQVQIARGYHINTHQPNSPDLVPSKLSLAAPAGIAIQQIAYPQARQHKVQGEDKPWLVWSDNITIKPVLRIDPQVTPGRYDLALALFYQACDDQMCQMPISEELNFAIEVIAVGQSSAPINNDVFK